MYAMRFRVSIRLVAAVGVAAANDAVLVAVGDLDTDTVNPTSVAINGNVIVNTYANPSGPVIRSLPAAVSAVMSVNSRLQRGLKTNVRFEVWGKPIGNAEAGNPDLTGDEKAEKLYIQGDTPSAGLLIAIARANHKPRASRELVYAPPVGDPEVGVPGVDEAPAP